MRTRTGKIARLPLAIREELNQRLLNNEPAKPIIAWLNSLPETQRIIAEMPGAGPIDDRNISDWRYGGFADWVKRRERVEHTRELAQYSAKLARASGGNMSDGAAAIAAGQILEVLEAIDEVSRTAKEEAGDDQDEEKFSVIVESIEGLSKSLALIRKGDHTREKLDLDRQKLGQDAEALELDKARFQRQTCELFMRWYEDRRAAEAVTAGASNEEKITKLGQLMFGEDFVPAQNGNA